MDDITGDFAWRPRAVLQNVSRDEVIEACYAASWRRYSRLLDERTRLLFAPALSGRLVAVLLQLEPIAGARTWWIMFGRPMTEQEEQEWRSQTSPR